MHGPVGRTARGHTAAIRELGMIRQSRKDRELGTGNREQTEEKREPGTGNGEQGTGNGQRRHCARGGSRGGLRCARTEEEQKCPTANARQPMLDSQCSTAKVQVGDGQSRRHGNRGQSARQTAPGYSPRFPVPVSPKPEFGRRVRASLRLGTWTLTPQRDLVHGLSGIQDGS